MAKIVLFVKKTDRLVTKRRWWLFSTTTVVESSFKVRWATWEEYSSLPIETSLYGLDKSEPIALPDAANLEQAIELAEKTANRWGHEVMKTLVDRGDEGDEDEYPWGHPYRTIYYEK